MWEPRNNSNLLRVVPKFSHDIEVLNSSRESTQIKSILIQQSEWKIWRMFHKNIWPVFWPRIRPKILGAKISAFKQVFFRVSRRLSLLICAEFLCVPFESV